MSGILVPARGAGGVCTADLPVQRRLTRHAQPVVALACPGLYLPGPSPHVYRPTHTHACGCVWVADAVALLPAGHSGCAGPPTLPRGRARCAGEHSSGGRTYRRRACCAPVNFMVCRAYACMSGLCGRWSGWAGGWMDGCVGGVGASRVARDGATTTVTAPGIQGHRQRHTDRCRHGSGDVETGRCRTSAVAAWTSRGCCTLLGGRCWPRAGRVQYRQDGARRLCIAGSCLRPEGGSTLAALHQKHTHARATAGGGGRGECQTTARVYLCSRVALRCGRARRSVLGVAVGSG